MPTASTWQPSWFLRSAAERLLLAVVLSGVIWACVFWALAQA